MKHTIRLLCLYVLLFAFVFLACSSPWQKESASDSSLKGTVIIDLAGGTLARSSWTPGNPGAPAFGDIEYAVYFIRENAPPLRPQGTPVNDTEYSFQVNFGTYKIEVFAFIRPGTSVNPGTGTGGTPIHYATGESDGLVEVGNTPVSIKISIFRLN